MRCLLILSLLAASACSKPAPQQGLPIGTYESGTRDALCIAKNGDSQRGGLIVYGAGGANCTVSGRIEPSAKDFVLIPAGEGACRIALRADGSSISVGSVPDACSYYCGPGVSFNGKRFNRGADSSVTDIAGDPLC